MSTLFEKVSKKLAKEIDRDLKIVNFSDATKISQFAILQKKKSTSLFREKPDEPVQVSLIDILEPNSSVSSIVSQDQEREGQKNKDYHEVKGPYFFRNIMVQKQKAGVSVSAGVDASLSGEATEFQEFDLEYQIVTTPFLSWIELKKRKVLESMLSALKSQTAAENLYVVTEIVQLVNSPKLQDVRSLNILGKLLIPWNTIFKGGAMGEDSKMEKREKILQKGMVMAYKKKKLIIKGNNWDISDDDKQRTFPEEQLHMLMSSGPVNPTILPIDISNDDQQRTFPEEQLHMLMSPGEWVILEPKVESDPLNPMRLLCTTKAPCDCVCSPYLRAWDLAPRAKGRAGWKAEGQGRRGQKVRGTEWLQTLTPICLLDPVNPTILPIGRIEEPFWRDFRCLQEEVSEKAEAVARLPRDVQDVVFSSVQDMLQDREALEALVHTLEQESLGHLNGPGSTILNKLQEDSGYSWSNTKYLILYLLEAIVVLNDTQLDLLAQSMEKGILLHQRELVRSILEPNFKYPWNIPFTLKPALLAPLQGEALVITCGLLEECGLEVKLNRPWSTWDLEANKQPLSALYGALSVLQQLAAA
nr:LOW QUALITY PROTEIN: gasdermin-C-like [Manis javanica]